MLLPAPHEQNQQHERRVKTKTRELKDGWVLAHGPPQREAAANGDQGDEMSENGDAAGREYL